MWRSLGEGAEVAEVTVLTRSHGATETNGGCGPAFPADGLCLMFYHIWVRWLGVAQRGSAFRWPRSARLGIEGRSES